MSLSCSVGLVAWFVRVSPGYPTATQKRPNHDARSGHRKPTNRSRGQKRPAWFRNQIHPVSCLLISVSGIVRLSIALRCYPVDHGALSVLGSNFNPNSTPTYTIVCIINSNCDFEDDQLTMATFTRIGDDEQPSISVDSRAVISKIDDNIYGGFTE